MNIEFKEGAVCYADCYQWYTHNGEQLKTNDANLDSMDKLLSCPTFKINEPREGWYIPKSELDTEEKYNQAVEVFGLFGYVLTEYSRGFDGLKLVQDGNAPCIGLGVKFDELLNLHNNSSCKVKCTFDQLMAIGDLKRKMLDKVEAELIAGSNLPEIPDSSKRNKSKQAYKILNDLGVEYDQVKQQWYKKKYL